MSKLIVIAGIKRSASTWMYNAARMAILDAGHTVYISGNGNRYKPNRPEDYQIIKIHPFREELAMSAHAVFTSERHIDDVRASMKRFNGKTIRDDAIGKMAYDLARWRRYSKYHMSYHDAGTDAAVSAICGVLGLPWSAELTSKINAIEPPADADYDPETMLFRNHITSR